MRSRPGVDALTPGRDTMDARSRLAVVAIFVAFVVDGIDLQMLALALPSISAEMRVSGVMAGALGTYTLLGMGIGGVLAGWLSDRVGRVRVTWWSILTFSLCTTLIGLSTTYWQVAFMRFCSGFGIAALYSVGAVLAAEYVPTRIRTTVLGILQAGWSVGYVIAALLSAWIIPAFGWRPLFLCAIVPGAAALVMLRGLEDPPSWFAARRAAVTAAGPRSNEFARIWADAPVRRTFLLWSLTSIGLQFGYYGASTWLPSYLVSDLGVHLQSMGWYVAATYAMMIVGKVVTGVAADRFGRRAVWVVAGLLTAIYLPLLTIAATPANVPYLLLVFGFLYGAPYAVNSTYMSESFPASIRGTAVATSYNVGRLGSTISPLLIGYAASHHSIGLGIGLLGVAYALCALLPGLFIREQLFDPSAVGSDGAARRSDSVRPAR